MSNSICSFEELSTFKVSLLMVELSITQLTFVVPSAFEQGVSVVLSKYFPRNQTNLGRGYTLSATHLKIDSDSTSINILFKFDLGDGVNLVSNLTLDGGDRTQTSTWSVTEIDFPSNSKLSPHSHLPWSLSGVAL